MLYLPIEEGQFEKLLCVHKMIQDQLSSMTVEIETFSLDDLCDNLYDKVNESVIHTLREQSITGAIFSQLTGEDLKELFPQVDPRLSAAMVMRELSSCFCSPGEFFTENT